MTLYRPVHDSFERFCRARVYGEMEYTDLMNETLLVAYRRMEDLRNEQAFLAFLFSIAVRVLSTMNRKKRTERLEDKAERVCDSNTHGGEEAMAVDELHRALAKLPDEQREALILFEINGFSIREIMAIQGAGESAVKQRLRRGRASLRALLEDVPVMIERK